MVPFPRLHFFMVGFAPLIPRGSRQFHSVSVPELTQQMFDARDDDGGGSETGEVLDCCGYFPWESQYEKEVEEQMRSVQTKNSSYCNLYLFGTGGLIF